MISLDYRDPRPVYEQVKAGVVRLITSRAMDAGDRMPSVRELASQLAVNPNTIQRAYRELEAEGYIRSAAGKGSFVADHAAAAARRREELYAGLDGLVSELRALGERTDAIVAHIRQTEEGETT